jgi:hypothetical protein
MPSKTFPSLYIVKKNAFYKITYTNLYSFHDEWDAKYDSLTAHIAYYRWQLTIILIVYLLAKRLFRNQILQNSIFFKYIKWLIFWNIYTLNLLCASFIEPCHSTIFRVVLQALINIYFQKGYAMQNFIFYWQNLRCLQNMRFHAIKLTSMHHDTVTSDLRYLNQVKISYLVSTLSHFLINRSERCTRQFFRLKAFCRVRVK